MKKRVAALVLGLATAAHADLPPPDGQKFVGYAFEVKDLGKFPDYVVLAYPYSLSNGRPTVEHAKLENGKQLALGRRSGLPKLYAMKKAAYEEWLKTYEKKDAYEDPALDALFTSDKVVPCDAKLSPRHTTTKDDPRDVIGETFLAKSIDDKTCQLALAGAPEAPKPPTKVASSEAPTTEAPSPAPPPAKGGCAGCSTPANAPAGSSLLLFAALALGLSRRARPSSRR